ncbi:diguanylate cyclase (GGDEF)-like protein [Stackebrandtia albiflava]|uniref:Diguanylate cyclase (GGDEF)-like protein n=1 Tax=Stackebrandtia albiflava TaxID=406432 RepID=A0A562V1L2_9ACTN|nr:diguanylate cyclase [Stackebrandtia albiflava]TWJ11806.1 diguanylate cyclase (GGDEF)-like protein [Stackebrandtia albiflava]
MPLRARLTAAFLVVVLGPVLLGALFIGAAVNTVSDGRAADRLAAAAGVVTTTVRNHCERLAATASAIAVLFEEDTAVITAAAARAVETAGLERLWLTDLTGEVVAQAGAAGTDVARQARCRHPGTVAGIDTVAAEVEVHDADGRTVGVARASMRVDGALVDSLARAAGADVIVDDGRSPPLSSFGPEDAATAADRLRLARLADGEDGPVVSDPNGAVVRTVPAMPDSPIPVVVAVHADSEGELFGVLIATVAVAGLLAVAAAAWLARSTTRPLAELARGAEAIARGDLEIRVPVRGNDELAALARSFNRMARETQGYVVALTASRDQMRGQLTLLGQTLSSTLDLERILPVIVDTAMVATGARAGVMLLADPDEPGALVGQAGHGPGGRDRVGDVRLAVGEGLLGHVAATGEPVHGRIGDPTLPARSPREPGGEVVLAVPVVSLADRGDTTETATGDALLGVLAVYDPAGEGEFDADDLSTLRDFAGQAAVAVGNVLSHREVRRLSLTDPLTGLWNYRYLQVSLAREVERAGRFHRRAAVIVIDLDKFKHVNDTFGHLAGDAVLTEVATRVAAEIRDVDLAFRYGGEEFVILLPETEAAGAERVAQRLWQAVRDTPVAVPSGAGQPERRIPVTVSLGIAVFPDHGDDGAQVLSAADGALYAAKAAGRDTWRVAGG